jgi:hypothetical protein
MKRNIEAFFVGIEALKDGWSGSPVPPARRSFVVPSGSFCVSIQLGSVRCLDRSRLGEALFLYIC